MVWVGLDSFYYLDWIELLKNRKFESVGGLTSFSSRQPDQPENRVTMLVIICNL